MLVAPPPPAGEIRWGLVVYFSVIPAKAGIHKFHNRKLWELWIPAFAGMTAKLLKWQ